MSIAANCTEDVMQRLRSIEEFKEKTFSVYSEEDLLDKSKLIKFPAVGVMYEGVRATSDPSRQGMSAELSVVIVLLMQTKAIGGLDQKNEAARLLDQIRDGVKLSTSPTGHKWRFVQEQPVGELGGALIYLQRWSTAVQLI